MKIKYYIYIFMVKKKVFDWINNANDGYITMKLNDSEWEDFSLINKNDRETLEECEINAHLMNTKIF